ncbi:MAG: DUF2461 family protein [Phycisphaerae bacterium]|nr:DUF2461 family protein [Saprospiraceae bacterium]
MCKDCANFAKRQKGILNNRDFKKYFGGLEGEKLKKVPADYTPDHPGIEYLKHKSFLATHKPTDKQVVSEDFLDHCGRVFKALNPLDQFLNRSMDKPSYAYHNFTQRLAKNPPPFSPHFYLQLSRCDSDR